MQSQHSFQESIVNVDKEACRVALAYSFRSVRSSLDAGRTGQAIMNPLSLDADPWHGSEQLLQFPNEGIAWFFLSQFRRPGY
jgi:hypothetical protein